MQTRTRVGRGADVGRIGAAVRAPGIDPRVWFSLAAVEAVTVEPNGVFADVVLMPDGATVTAHVGYGYAGPGYGFYLPIGVDDTVVVAAPSGDPAHGYVVVARLHSASDQVPQEAQGNPSDVVLHVKDGANVRIVTTGGGSVTIDTQGSPVYLAGNAGNLVSTPGLTNNGVVLGQGLDPFTGQTYSQLGSASGKVLAAK